jgi:hypothetical protein
MYYSPGMGLSLYAGLTVLTKQNAHQFVARHIQLGRDIRHNRRERADLDGVMIGDSKMVLRGLLQRKPYMTAPGRAPENRLPATPQRQKLFRS